MPATCCASTCPEPNGCAARSLTGTGWASSPLAPLADPTRLGVAIALGDAGELCGCDLAWVTGRSQGVVSHHVKALKAAGLVRSRRDGKLVMHALSDEGDALLAAVRRSRVTA